MPNNFYNGISPFFSLGLTHNIAKYEPESMNLHFDSVAFITVVMKNSCKIELLNIREAESKYSLNENFEIIIISSI